MTSDHPQPVRPQQPVERKSQTSVVVRMDRPMYDQLTRAARDEDRSMAAVTRLALRRYLDKDARSGR